MKSQTLISNLKEESLTMIIGKEVRLVEDLYSSNNTRCLKKENTVGILVEVRPYFEEATVQFGKRNHKIDFSKLTINKIEDEQFILAEEKAKQERIALAEKLILERNQLVEEYNSIVVDQDGGVSSRFLDRYPLHWVQEENSEEDIKDYVDGVEFAKERLNRLKSEAKKVEAETEEDEIEISLTNADNVVSFEQERLFRGVNKLWKEFENLSPDEVIKETYTQTLYYYTCGQSGKYNLGWLKGVEYMMDAIGMDYKTLRKQVLNRIKNEGRTIVNNFFYEDTK